MSCQWYLWNLFQKKRDSLSLDERLESSPNLKVLSEDLTVIKNLLLHPRWNARLKSCSALPIGR